MDSVQLKNLLAKLLEEHPRFEKVFALGNCVYAWVDGVEFEVVVRTATPERRWDEKRYGPLAQE